MPNSSAKRRVLVASDSSKSGAHGAEIAAWTKAHTISTLPKRRLLSRFRAPSRPTFRYRIQAPVIQILGAAIAEDR
jgi:hypothetical protein